MNSNDLKTLPPEQMLAWDEFFDDVDAAKAKVEYCNSPNEGMELYTFAYNKLKKITCEICC